MTVCINDEHKISLNKQFFLVKVLFKKKKKKKNNHFHIQLSMALKSSTSKSQVSKIVPSKKFEKFCEKILKLIITCRKFVREEILCSFIYSKGLYMKILQKYRQCSEHLNKQTDNFLWI